MRARVCVCVCVCVRACARAMVRQLTRQVEPSISQNKYIKSGVPDSIVAYCQGGVKWALLENANSIDSGNSFHPMEP